MLQCTGQEYFAGPLSQRYDEGSFSDDLARLTAGRSLSYATKLLQERGCEFLQQIG
jgi:hypothetical protein